MSSIAICFIYITNLFDPIFALWFLRNFAILNRVTILRNVIKIEIMNMKKSILSILFVMMGYLLSAQYIEKSNSLNQEGAMRLAKEVNAEAQKLDKKVSIAVLNNSGVVLLLLKGDYVGPHNTEASRRKAYTSFSTKNASLDLMNNAAKSKDAQNLNTLPELLLLGGGMPVFKDGELIGSIGVSGGGSGENDHHIAKKSVENLGFKISK